VGGILRRAALLALVAIASGAHAQESSERGEAHGSVRVFAQPVSPDWLLVITPAVTGKVRALKWLSFDVDWTADIVTGATPRTYGSPDVVTSATQFSEFRNVIGAGAAATVGPATITAGYDYGTENDYRSHLIRFGASGDFFHHNTTVALNYAHSFDSICDLAQPGVPLTLRQPLDSARGCFTGNASLTEESLGIDTVEATLTQTLTKTLVGSIGGSYQHLGGFQSNPYRRVRLSYGLFQAQESHPTVRDRGALTARIRWAVAKLSATLGADLRLYLDTWGIASITGELSWDMPFNRAAPAWRYVVRARGYGQSGATFYRDAGNPDSYEKAGPAGSFFTADQELAPLADLLLGARFVHNSTYDSDKRKWKMFTAVEWAFSFDYVKMFALTPEPPNAPRLRGWASALVAGASATGKF
jgi:hypothetical protein